VGKINAIYYVRQSRFDKTTKKQHLVMHSDSFIFSSFDYFNMIQIV